MYACCCGCLLEQQLRVFPWVHRVIRDIRCECTIFVHRFPHACIITHTHTHARTHTHTHTHTHMYTPAYMSACIQTHPHIHIHQASSRVLGRYTFAGLRCSRKYFLASAWRHLARRQTVSSPTRWHACLLTLTTLLEEGPLCQTLDAVPPVQALVRPGLPPCNSLGL